MEPNLPNTEDARLHQALLAYVRREFEGPVGGILDKAEMMLGCAEQGGLHPAPNDLRRLHQAGLKLKELVTGLHRPISIHQDFADFRRNFRHDLRTQIGVIKGFGEMLLEDADDARNEVQARDLEKLIEATACLLARTDTLADFTLTPRSAAIDGNPGSEAVSADPEPIQPLSAAAIGEPGSSRILIVDD